MTYAETKAKAALDEFETKTGVELPHSATLCLQVRATILEAMRDQRHACAEAVQTADFGTFNISTYRARRVRDRLHQAVMNAEPKIEE